MSAYINSLVFIKFVWYYYNGKKYVRYLISASISILIRTCNLSNKQIGTKQLYRYVPICYYSISSADSNSLFEGLWEEWLSLNVFLLAREMQLADVLYDDLFNNLPKEKQSELTGRKDYFAKKAGITL